MKKILSLLLAVVMVIGMLPAGAIFASAAEETATITFDDVSKRTTFTTSQQVWVENGITVTNNKSSSTTNVANYSKPARFYAGSELIIEHEGMTQIVFDCNSSSYATAMQTSIGTVDGATVTVSSDKVTVGFTSAVDSFTVAKLSGQVRMDGLTVTYQPAGDTECDHADATVTTVDATCTTPGSTTTVCDCGYELVTTIPALGHTWGDWTTTTAATCAVAGSQEHTCSVCSATESEEIPATGHSYENGVCTVCGANVPVAVASLITTAAEFTSGEYVLVVSSGAAMGALDGSWVTAVQPEILDGAVLDAANGVWTLTVNGSSVTIVDANGVSIAPKGGNENGIISGEYSWTWSVNDDGTFVFAGTGEDTTKLASNTGSDNKFRAYKNATIEGNTTSYLANFAVYKMNAGGEVEPDPEEPTCEHTETTTTTVNATCTENGSTTVTCNACGETVSTEVIEATGHNYVDGVCSVCGEADPNAGTDENVNIVFELGANGDATHNDGKEAATYTETVNGYTLTITDGVKMYTGAVDAKGNSCIKLGTNKLVGGFSFTAPDDVTEVVISIAKYKANNTTVNVNGTNYTLTNNSNDGAYDEITVDTSSNKTVTVTTVASTYRAMVNSITFICGSDSETGHTCEWDEGTVTTAATCTTDGVKTYSCTVDGCEKTKTETIKATGHSYTYTETAITCANCDYSATYTLTSLADARAAAIAAGTSNSASTYYIKGIVTYISDKNVYIEDSTAGFLVYFTSADDAASLALGDEILVWDTVKTYNGLTETSGTTSSEFAKGSSGNALPSQTITLAQLKADTTNEYLCERVTIAGLNIGVLGTNNTAMTDADGNSINIYKAPALSEDINENDTVTVTAIVSTYNGYQLLINPGTAAADVVETAGGEETVVTTVTIAEAKAGTAGEYYQVEGVVTFIDGRNVYIQDATGGIVVYLTADAATTQVGDTVKAYGALKVYNGLIELDAVDETNTEFYNILSSGNTVDAQEVTIADLLADSTNEYLAEKITLSNVYVSYSYDYSSSYANVTYVLKDGENTITIYRAPAASEDALISGGSIVNVEAIVSSYKGYQLRIVGIESITVVGTCAHETTNLVNVTAATCTEAGYTGDTECVACGNYTVRGEETAALGHNYDANGVCANECGIAAEWVAVYTSLTESVNYPSVAAALSAIENEYPEALYIKLLHNVQVDAVVLYTNLYIDMNGFDLSGSLSLDDSELVISVFDSSTDAYTCGEDRGVFSCTVDGKAYKPEAVVKDASITGTVKRYMAIADGDGYSFHRYYMGITHMSLKPGTTGVGYKAIFAGDEMVRANVASYGYTLQLEGEEAINVTKSGSFVSGKAVTLRIDDYDVVKHGTTGLTASVTLTLNDGTVLESASITKTMQEMVEAVNADISKYTAAQIVALQSMLGKEEYAEAISTWNVSSITGYVAA